MLDKKMLMDMPPDTIFAQGEIIDSPEGVNMSNSGKLLKWVACRGGYYDWCIYIQFAIHDFDYVKRMGDKIITEFYIKRLVPCDDEAFELYRY